MLLPSSYNLVVVVDNARESTHQLTDDTIMVTYYKLNLIIPVLDQLLIGLEKRFATHPRGANYKCLIPYSDRNQRSYREQFIANVHAFINQYRDDIPVLRTCKLSCIAGLGVGTRNQPIPTEKRSI